MYHNNSLLQQKRRQSRPPHAHTKHPCQDPEHNHQPHHHANTPPLTAKKLHYPLTKETLLATKKAIGDQLTTNMASTVANKIHQAYHTATTMLAGNHTAQHIKNTRTILTHMISVPDLAEKLMTQHPASLPHYAQNLPHQTTLHQNVYDQESEQGIREAQQLPH